MWKRKVGEVSFKLLKRMVVVVVVVGGISVHKGY